MKTVKVFELEPNKYFEYMQMFGDKMKEANKFVKVCGYMHMYKNELIRLDDFASLKDNLTFESLDEKGFESYPFYKIEIVDGCLCLTGEYFNKQTGEVKKISILKLNYKVDIKDCLILSYYVKVEDKNN